MSPLDIGAAIDRCERLLSEAPILITRLRSPEFVSGKLDKIQTLVSLLGNPTPSLGIILQQLYTFLLNDDEIREILRDECDVEDNEDFFPFFMLFCAVVVYTEHIKLGKKIEGGE